MTQSLLPTSFLQEDLISSIAHQIQILHHAMVNQIHPGSLETGEEYKILLQSAFTPTHPATHIPN